jgi:hypothetical protein
MSENKPSKRFSPVFIAIIIITLFLSLTSFYQALNAYLASPPRTGEVIYLMIMGLIGIAIPIYMLFQTRSKIQHLISEPQSVSTTILCKKCGLKNIREFQRGDYILKDVEVCPKCNETMVITSIYGKDTEEKD